MSLHFVIFIYAQLAAIWQNSVMWVFNILYFIDIKITIFSQTIHKLSFKRLHKYGKLFYVIFIVTVYCCIKMIPFKVHVMFTLHDQNLDRRLGRTFLNQV